MTNNYQLTNEAVLELENIYIYSIESFGKEQAQKYMTELHSTFELLADNPKLGRDCSHIKEGYRKHDHQRHSIYYKLANTSILIARILGEKQNQLEHLK